METQSETAHTVWRPRPPEDREIVRRQQKELRRVRQRARRETMSEEQIEQRRERGREYYQRKKNVQLMKKTKRKNVSAGQARLHQIDQPKESNILKFCTTAEEIMQLRQQKSNLENKQLMEQTQINTTVDHQQTDHIVQSGGSDKLNPHNNRLTHVRRQARRLNHQVPTSQKDVWPRRLIHIRRLARTLRSRVVDRSAENGNCFPKLGHSLDNSSSSLMQEPAQILVDISRMKKHTSTDMAGNSRESVGIDLNKRAADINLHPYEDTDETTSGSEGGSDTEEVLAFLSGLSAKKGIVGS